MIRRISPEDAFRVREVRLRALATDPLAFGSTYEREVGFPDSVWAERARDQATSNDRATFIALRGDTIIGTIVGIRSDEHEDVFDIFAMWVAPEARRTGVARALLASLESFIVEHGGVRAQLHVTSGAPEAQRLYESSGYVMDGRSKAGAHPGIVERFMTKLLIRTSDTGSKPPAAPPSPQRA